RNNKRYYRTFTMMILLYAVIDLFTGNRYLAIPMIVSLGFMYLIIENKKKFKVNYKKVIIYTLLTLLLLSILPAIKGSRGLTDGKVSTFFEIYKESFVEENPIILSINEMGNSATPLIETMNVIPSRFPYHNGETYYWAFTAILPNLF